MVKMFYLGILVISQVWIFLVIVNSWAYFIIYHIKNHWFFLSLILQTTNNKCITDMFQYFQHSLLLLHVVEYTNNNKKNKIYTFTKESLSVIKGNLYVFHKVKEHFRNVRFVLFSMLIYFLEYYFPFHQRYVFIQNDIDVKLLCRNK